MGWAGLDQREFPRVSAQCDISIHDRIGGAIKAKTQNLGVGGVCVILSRELEKLSVVHLKVTLENSTQTVECDGRVVWMVRSKELSSRKIFFDIGIEFLNLKPEDQDAIGTFIKGRV